MPTPSVQRSEASPVGFNIAAIMLALALCGLGLAYAIDAAGRRNLQATLRLDEETTLTRTIGNRELEIPQSWFRYAEQRVEGFAKHIDLQLTLPLGENGAARDIEVTLLPRSRARPSSRLLDGVYLHRFLADEVSGPPGLVGKPLAGKDGFENETVWYDPLSADPFVAKCGAPVTADAEPRCLRTVYLGNSIAAVYAFGADVLISWRDFDAEMKPWLESIGAY
jgi:hypothetical protein